MENLASESHERARDRWGTLARLQMHVLSVGGHQLSTGKNMSRARNWDRVDGGDKLIPGY
jgi:hypothetical protein